MKKKILSKILRYAGAIATIYLLSKLMAFGYLRNIIMEMEPELIFAISGIVMLLGWGIGLLILHLLEIKKDKNIKPPKE